MIDDVLYCNDGDWVESLTALVEHHDGQLALVDASRPELRTVRSPAVMADGTERELAGGCVLP